MDYKGTDAAYHDKDPSLSQGRKKSWVPLVDSLWHQSVYVKLLCGHLRVMPGKGWL